ncbi:NAD(P)-binding domain-containing protein [Nocardioides sp. BYT-33-1]|uniref:NAD(P)-binding domain-containing protein n=1 Tax=Nocardioides sp. BYT-33-1 TaxID=3416952 RepID=UPI003F5346A4
MPAIALLGLGRMGAAMASRLSDRGHTVVTWTRSGRTVASAAGAATATEAVARADLVLLCLFDGPACAAVIDEVADALRPTAVVVNTATVGPEEARALAERVAKSGAGYVHAPVLGSTAAAASGALTVLAGGAPWPDPALADTVLADTVLADTVLADLGDVLPCGDVASAAAAKLVANGVLAGALLTIRDSLARAGRLGLDPVLTLDLLERTTLGRLVAAKRDRLATGDLTDADFTASALAKDVALLAGALAPGDDIAGLGRLPHRLTIAASVAAPPEAIAPLRDYVAGHATGDPAYHRRAFLPSAHVEGLRDGAVASWTLEEYCALFTGSPAPDEPARWRRIDHLSVTGTTGVATMTLHHGRDVLTDSFALLRVDGAWRIANKTYHRATA